MKFEHFALNIPDTRATSQWYVANLGLRVARQMAEDPYTTFLADDSGRIIIEFYSNKAAIFPDYASSHPLCFHIAFVSGDPVADAKRLKALEIENARLKKLLAESMLEIEVTREVLRKKW